MNATEYLKARLELLKHTSPEEFLKADDYTQAAARLCEAHEILPVQESIATVAALALELAYRYPEGLPLTFKQLARLKEADPGFKEPPQGDVMDWWVKQ